MRVLVVEDDGVVRGMLTANLRRAGHVVLAADSAQGALDVIVERSTTPAAAVLGIGLPDMDPFELVRALREHPDMTDLPVIVLAERLSGHDVDTVRSLGCVWLTRPFTGSELVAAVERSTATPPHRDAVGRPSAPAAMIRRRPGYCRARTRSHRGATVHDRYHVTARRRS